MLLPNSTQLTKNARNFKDFAQLQREIKAQSGEEVSSLTIYYLKDDKKYSVLDTQKTFEEYKEYKKTEKNIKVYFIKNTEYKPTEHLVERIQAKGGNQASLVKE